MLAAAKGHKHMAEVLLGQGADMAAKDNVRRPESSKLVLVSTVRPQWSIFLSERMDRTALVKDNEIV